MNDIKTIQEMTKESPKETKEENVDPRFYQENLIEEIHKEIDKKHKLDHKEKLALFFIRVTAELKNPSDRKSAAIKGDSSAGKDNAIKTILDLFPSKDNKFLTHTTPAALRKSIQNVKCVAFSEMNVHRENGANSDIVETFKQMAEGGINAEICDPRTKEPILLESDQKTLFYGTTDTATDEELETRYVIIPLRGYEIKNKQVVESMLESVSNEEEIINRLISKQQKKENWIAKSIKNLDHDIEIIIPFSKMLQEPIKDIDGKKKYLFDYSKARIMRDAKRLMSLTKSIAWIHQKQRLIVKKQGIKLLYAEPSDFLIAISLFAEFFNLTYTGLDHRMQTTYKKIKELQGKHDAEILKMGYDSKYFGWVLRHKLAEELGIQSVDTIKKRINQLKDFQMVEGYYQHDIPRGYLIRGCEQGTNRVLLPISLVALVPYLGGYLVPSILTSIYKDKKISSNWASFECFFQKLVPSKLAPLISQKNTIKSIKNSSEGVKEKFSVLAGSSLTPSTILKEFHRLERPLTISELSSSLNTKEEVIESLLQEMTSSGDVFESKPGLWSAHK